mmetsp:Transcript_126063/g.362627  ORF Transcript_126063/g.362627 Transcript_126063/m.362627 type:complete len:319 (+) Transcript_126063:499-1455(+)
MLLPIERIAVIALGLATGEGHLVAEGCAVAAVERLEGGEHVFAVTLRHAHQADLRDGLRPARRVTELGRPTANEVVLYDGRLRHGRADGLDEGEGLDEAGENGLGKLQCELLATFERERLGPGEVRQPMHEVEADVARGDFPRRNDLLERPQQCAWWRLGLHEPAHVVFEFAVCEPDALLLRLRKARERRQRGRETREHEAERDVVVSDHLAGLEPGEGALVDGGLKDRKLHDVMDGQQHQHGYRALLVVPASGRLEEPRLHQEVPHGRPIHVLVELQLFPPALGNGFCAVRIFVVVAGVLELRNLPRFPKVVDAETE